MRREDEETRCDAVQYAPQDDLLYQGLSSRRNRRIIISDRVVTMRGGFSITRRLHSSDLQ
jgi:hypothetical protein